MLDTLKLRLNKVNISRDANLIIKQGNLNYQTGEISQRLLFRDSKGRDIFGAGAFLNTDKIHFDITAISQGVYPFVSFSLPKMIRDNNYQPIAREELEPALNQVELELLNNGIEAEIDSAFISRLDMNKDILTDESIESYAKLFELLKANRTKNKKTYDTSGWLMSNSRTEYAIYNKIEEMESHNINVSGMPETLRFEHRCLVGNKVKEFYHFTTVEGLKAYGFDALIEKQAENWRDNFFKYEIDEIEYMVESLLRTQMQYFQAKYGRNFFSKYLKAYGAYYLATSSGGIEVVKRALDNMDCNRKRVYRAGKELSEALIEIEAIKPEPINRKSLASLYNELKEKVCCERI